MVRPPGMRPTRRALCGESHFCPFVPTIANFRAGRYPAAATAAPAARTTAAGLGGGSSLGNFKPTFFGRAATGCAS